MQKKSFFRLSLLVTALALTQSVWALGLGRLTVQSALGQALNAQIELMGTRDEFSELTAKIAAPALYQEKDLVYQAVLTRTRLTLERRADGSAFLKVVSSQPVTEPYIELLVEVNWPAGHALREYTVLLDPPNVGQPEPMMPAQQATVSGRTAASAAKTAAATPAAPAPAAKAAPAAPPPPAAAQPASSRQPTPTREGSAGGTEYTVQRGDTLSNIARSNKTDEITLNQALTALYKANPSAFIGKNMNRLRTGTVLKVPSQEAMAETSVRAANHVVRVQVAEWRSYLGQVANQPAAVQPGTGGTTAGGAITSAPTVVEDTSKGKGKLTVSAGSGQQNGQRGSRQAAGSNAAATATATAEEQTSMGKALDEEKSRVKDLEETVKKLQQVIELKNQQLAQLQQQAKNVNTAKTPAVEPPKSLTPAEPPKQLSVTEPAKQTPATASPKPPEPIQQAPQPQTQPQAQPAGAAKPAETTPAAAAGQSTAAPAAPVTATEGETASQPPKQRPRIRPAPPPPAPSLFEKIVGIIAESWSLIAGLAVVVIAGIGLLVYRRRRAEEVAVDSLFGATTTSATMTGEASQLSSHAAVAGPISTHSVHSTASSNSILSEFSREGLGSIDTGEVDPLAEADVYLAYGRAQQAEEILQDALKRGPDRQDVFLKLLEVYADEKKTSEFEATANQLHTLTNGKGEYWQRAAVIGQRLLPGNPLFAGAVEATDESEITHTHTATEQMVVGGQAVDPRGFLPMEGKSIAERAADIANRAIEARGAMSAQPPKSDFSFSSSEGAPLLKDDIGVDLDLEELSRFKDYGKPEEQVDLTGVRAQQSNIDFNLDDFDAPPPIDEEKEASLRAPSLAELDFSENDSISGDLSPSVLRGQWHDAATKLDLARAYQATGDIEACREILQEVLQEGDDQQKADAKAILQTLT